jgi:hypothetical protein
LGALTLTTGTVQPYFLVEDVTVYSSPRLFPSCLCLLEADVDLAFFPSGGYRSFSVLLVSAAASDLDYFWIFGFFVCLFLMNSDTNSSFFEVDGVFLCFFLKNLQ